MKKIVSALVIVIAAITVGCSAGEETTEESSAVVAHDGYVARTTESGSSIVANVETTNGTPVATVSYDRATRAAGMVLESRASSIAVRLQRPPSADEMGDVAIALVRALPRPDAHVGVGPRDWLDNFLAGTCGTCAWVGGADGHVECWMQFFC